MKVEDIANDIWFDLGSPTSTSIPTIAYWLRTRVGDINVLLYEEFIISDTYEIVDGSGNEITPEAVAIIKKLYKVYDYDVSIRSFMNAMATDSILEVSDQGSSVKKVNRNEISKTLATLKTTEVLALNQLITSYRSKSAAPTQVAGDDCVPGWYGTDPTITPWRIRY